MTCRCGGGLAQLDRAQMRGEEIRKNFRSSTTAPTGDAWPSQRPPTSYLMFHPCGQAGEKVNEGGTMGTVTGDVHGRQEP